MSRSKTSEILVRKGRIRDYSLEFIWTTEMYTHTHSQVSSINRRRSMHMENKMYLWELPGRTLYTDRVGRWMHWIQLLLGIHFLYAIFFLCKHYPYIYMYIYICMCVCMYVHKLHNPGLWHSSFICSSFTWKPLIKSIYVSFKYLSSDFQCSIINRGTGKFTCYFLIRAASK